MKLDVYFLELSCPFLGHTRFSAMRSGNGERERERERGKKHSLAMPGTTFSLCILLPSCTNLSGKPDDVAHATTFTKTDYSNTASAKLTENYGKLGACRFTGCYVQISPVPLCFVRLNEISTFTVPLVSFHHHSQTIQHLSDSLKISDCRHLDWSSWR